MRYCASAVTEVSSVPIAHDRNKGRQERDGLDAYEPWIERR